MTSVFLYHMKALKRNFLKTKSDPDEELMTGFYQSYLDQDSIKLMNQQKQHAMNFVSFYKN